MPARYQRHHHHRRASVDQQRIAVLGAGCMTISLIFTALTIAAA